MNHPWRILRSLPHIDVHWHDDLGHDVRGLTDGVKHIWLSTRLSQVQRRCTLMHELVHVERAHRGCQPPPVEASVRRESARRLVPDVRRIGQELAWAHDLAEAADHLWVTTEVLRTRLEALHPAERAWLVERLEGSTWA